APAAIHAAMSWPGSAWAGACAVAEAGGFGAGAVPAELPHAARPPLSTPASAIAASPFVIVALMALLLLLRRLSPVHVSRVPRRAGWRPEASGLWNSAFRPGRGGAEGEGRVGWLGRVGRAGAPPRRARGPGGARRGPGAT